MSREKFLDRAVKGSKELARLRKLADHPKRLSGSSRQGLARYPGLFRSACQSLALARHRDYSTTVVAQLNRVALESHHQMYGSPQNVYAGGVRFLTATFPRAFRAEPWLAFWAFTMMFAPIFIIAVMVQWYPELPYSILESAQLRQVEAMYSNEGGVVLLERPVESDVIMFGLYVKNNVGIAFWTFAAGVFYGIGSCFFLLFNGVMFGAIGGHLHRIGAGENLYGFVVGHGSLELTGIAIAGMSGLVIGRSLLKPGQYTRAQSFRMAARQSLTLISGAAIMIFLAAFVEAFWSPRVLPSSVKYTVGSGLWVIVIAYLALAGRWSREP